MPGETTMRISNEWDLRWGKLEKYRAALDLQITKILSET